MRSFFSVQPNQTRRGISILFILLILTLVSGSSVLAYGLSTKAIEKIAQEQVITPLLQGYSAFQESWVESQAETVRRRMDKDYVHSVQVKLYQETASQAGQVNTTATASTSRVVRSNGTVLNQSAPLSTPATFKQQSTQSQSNPNKKSMEEFEAEIEAQKAAFAAYGEQRFQEAQATTHQNYLEAEQQAQLNMEQAKADSAARIKAFKELHGIE